MRSVTKEPGVADASRGPPPHIHDHGRDWARIGPAAGHAGGRDVRGTREVCGGGRLGEIRAARGIGAGRGDAPGGGRRAGSVKLRVGWFVRRQLACRV